MKIVPVGSAFQEVRNARPDLILNVKDGSHATDTGKWLRDLVTYCYFLEKLPIGVGIPEGVSESNADYLKNIAWETVKEWKDL